MHVHGARIVTMFQDGGFKDMVSINMKKRDDNYSDQFSRIFIVKMLVLSAVITGKFAGFHKSFMKI